MSTADTAALILDAAQELVQTRGYNAFSYRDLAERVGIKAASIHYHFPSKADLGRALIARYDAIVSSAVEVIERQSADAPTRLRGYASLLEEVLAPLGVGASGGGKVCLGGMLASDYPTLPPEVQKPVRAFIENNVQWLARILSEGRAAGSLRFDGSAESAATALFSALEGAMFVARSVGDVNRYRAATEWLISFLSAT